MTFGSLFAGFGGFDLGFERAGMECKWQVEINEYARRVLAKHWPDVRRHDDVRTFPPSGRWKVDIIAGGFPCQDISQANVVSRSGLDGERSGLWREMLRVIVHLEPRWCVIENSYQQRRKWMPVVRRQLWEHGYVSVSLGINSTAFGTRHARRRCVVVADTNGDCESAFPVDAEAPSVSEIARAGRQDWRTPPPCALGVADGVSNRSQRLRGLGNAVCPDVAQWIAERIMNLTPTP